IQILPEEVKKVIEKRLVEGVKPSYRRTEADTRTVDELIVFLNEKIDKPFDEFFRYVNRHDVYRKESYPEVFPEFYNLISSYVPDYLIWGKTDLLDIQDKTTKSLLNFLLDQKEVTNNNQEYNSQAQKVFSQIHQMFSESYHSMDIKFKYEFFNKYKDMLHETNFTLDFFESIMFL